MCLHLHAKACKVGALATEKSAALTNIPHNRCAIIMLLSLEKKYWNILKQSLNCPQQHGVSFEFIAGTNIVFSIVYTLHVVYVSHLPTASFIFEMNLVQITVGIKLQPLQC